MNRGFTLIELLVVIAITAVLASVGFINLFGYQQRKNLILTGDEMVAVLRSARNNSVSQEQGSRWGVHFENTTSTAETDFYALFWGNSYAVSTSSQKVALPGGINFSNPIAGQSFDVIFSGITGESSSTVISLVGSSAGAVENIVIKNNGGVSNSLDEGLVGYWHFDEGTGHATTTDASGYGNTGTLTNSPTWASGASCKSGGCISFDGTNYVNLGNVQNFNFGSGAFSVVIWYYSTGDLTHRFHLITKGNNDPGGATMYGFYLGSPFYYYSGCATSYYVRLSSYSSQYQCGSGISGFLNNWHQLAVARDSTNALSVYLDGILVKSASTNIDITTQSIAYIGAWGGTTGSGSNFKGLIDEARIYNRALSATEVLNLYNDFK